MYTDYFSHVTQTGENVNACCYILIQMQNVKGFVF